MALTDLEGLVAMTRLEHRVAAGLENISRELPDGPLVLHQQNRLTALGRVSQRRTASATRPSASTTASATSNLKVRTATSTGGRMSNRPAPVFSASAGIVETISTSTPGVDEKLRTRFGPQ